jgi:hypothetical protein
MSINGGDDQSVVSLSSNAYVWGLRLRTTRRMRLIACAPGSGRWIRRAVSATLEAIESMLRSSSCEGIGWPTTVKGVG